MRFSALTPFGHLGFVNRPPPAEAILRELIAAEGPHYDRTAGGYHDGVLYARALGYARLTLYKERLRRQFDAPRATDLLEAHRVRYGVAPGPDADVRAGIRQRRLLARGAGRGVLEEACQAILGSKYLALRSLSSSEVYTWPTSPGLGPGVFTDPTVTPKFGTLTDGAWVLGTPHTVPYSGDTLVAGDVLSVDLANLGRAEQITVTAVGGGTLTATFQFPHDVGVRVRSGPCPLWLSGRRQLLVVVRYGTWPTAAELDALHDHLARSLRGTTRWAVVSADVTNTYLSPATVATAPIAATLTSPIEALVI